MIAGAIGRRYAKALLEVARDTGKIEEILSEMTAFGKALEVSPELNLLMSDPTFEAEERKKSLDPLSKVLKISPLLLKFLSLLIDRDRMGQFEEILLSYRDQSDQALGRVRVQVTASDAFSEPAE